MKEENNKSHKILRITIAVVLSLVILAPIAYYVYLVTQYWPSWKSNLWISFIGWALAFLIQLTYRTSERNLMISIFKGMRTMTKWDAGNWFLRGFLWICIILYGTLLAIAVPFVATPICLWLDVKN